MSPSKQKSNERQAARDRKSLTRQVVSGGTSANAYNPTSGTFHALESIAADSGLSNLNVRFKSIDDGEDNTSSNGAGGELECISNNGSCSGESEDQAHINGKEKQGVGKSGVASSTDKRDKVRGKNERKHQRQKERRAQELRDKCTSYLMSRKLEALSQQLVAMGFPQERATMALICNDGHVERSVAWLLEGSEGQVHEAWNSGGSPKIDISEELNYILEIEKMYKFSRPDIERAIVSFEGDLAKAIESLRARSRSLSPGREDVRSAQISSSSNPPYPRKEEPCTSIPAAPPAPGPSQQVRATSSGQPPYIRKDERASTHFVKGRQQTTSATSPGPQEILTRGSAHPRKLSNPLIDFSNSLPSVERPGHVQTGKLPVGVSKTQSPFSSPQFAPVSTPHVGLVFGAAGADSKLFPLHARETNVAISAKESATKGQPHILLRASSQPFIGLSNSPAPSSIPSSPSVSSSSRSYSFMDIGSPSSVLYANASQGDMGLKDVNARKILTNSSDGVSDFVGSFNPLGSFQSEPPTSHPGYRTSSAMSVAPSLNTALHARSSSGTSYGLFTGWGSNFSHSLVDWSTGPMPNCDYRNIDWSMNATPNTLQGISSRLNSLALQQKGSNFRNADDQTGLIRGLGPASYMLGGSQGHGTWKVGSSGGPVARERMSLEPESNTAHEWTSPFAGKDLFSLLQVVPSPSL